MRLLAALFGLLSGAALAQPVPVQISVASIWEGGILRLRLTEDRCFTWSEPTFEQTGFNFVVRQSVTPGTCTPSTGSHPVEEFMLGRPPVGSYTLTYVQQASAFAPEPPSSVPFVVRPQSIRQVAFEPYRPVALEPVTMSFSIDNCESISRFAVVDGGFRVELASDDSNPFVCDAVFRISLTLGAFPPGSYRVDLARPAAQGGTLISSQTLVVGPGGPPPSPDWSGLWHSPLDEPSTGIFLIQSGTTRETDTITGLWYRYDANGGPVWLVFVVDWFGGTVYTGQVLRFAATNASAPPSQRVAVPVPIGTIRLSLNDLEQPSRVEATIDGRPVAFRIERFRWLRGAWPVPPAAY